MVGMALKKHKTVYFDKMQIICRKKIKGKMANRVLSGKRLSKIVCVL